MYIGAIYRPGLKGYPNPKLKLISDLDPPKVAEKGKSPAISGKSRVKYGIFGQII